MLELQHVNLSTIADSLPNEPISFPFDINVSSQEVLAPEYLIETCERYLITVEQGEVPIEEFSCETIREYYDRLMIQDEKDSLRYRIEALHALQALEERLIGDEEWPWDEWEQTYQKIKHLVISRLQKQYLKRLEAIRPEPPVQKKQEPTIDEQLSELLGESYQNLPSPLRHWLKEQVASQPESLETVSIEKLKQLDSEWSYLQRTPDKDDWLARIKTTVLYQEAKKTGVLEDWEAVFDKQWNRWDQILQAVKNQAKRREREEMKALEGDGIASTLHKSSISKVITD